jgi:SAM-dependent methyltransferase
MAKVAGKGWFAIPGVQAGDRTLDEQLLGLEPMLKEVPGKIVLDLGSAEGLISRTCVERGARRVVGLEVNKPMLAVARQWVCDPNVCQFEFRDLNKTPSAEDSRSLRADIVLALAVFHKLSDPEKSVRDWVRFAGELVVVRLPVNSNGEFHSKFRTHMRCDLNQLMPRLGFQLERVERGPRTERVQYWRRMRWPKAA